MSATHGPGGTFVGLFRQPRGTDANARASLEIVLPVIFERESASSDRIPDRRRDQDLVRPGHRRHARADVDGDTLHLASRDLDLTRVHIDSDLKTSVRTASIAG